MKLIGVAALGALTAGVWADSFEPADFNVTEALLDTGLNVSAIPGLAGLAERSFLSACSIAVRRTHSAHQLAPMTNTISVQCS